MTEAEDTDAPKPPRSLPRAARLSRVHSPSEPTAVPAPPPDVPPDVPAPPPPPLAPSPPPVAPPAVPAPPPPPPPPAPSPPPVAPPPPPTPAQAPTLEPAPPTPSLPSGDDVRSRAVGPVDDVVDLANAIARASAAQPSTSQASPGTKSSAGSVGGSPPSFQSTPSMPTMSASPTSPSEMSGSTNPSGSPVRFRPLVDVWANRSVIVSSFGLLLCFLPVISLIGMVLGLVSLRRINGSDGMFIGTKTARFGAILGACGLVIGIVVDVIFVVRS